MLNTLAVYDIPPMVPPKKLPPENAEFKPPETIPGRKLLMAPALLDIFPSAPEMAAPPMAPPTTALHVFCQSHLPESYSLRKQKQDFLLLF
ncbi:hypothetical protein [Chryseobacterium sp. SIMBA_028]|uniref:hypothetical protein n=1 Tax=Chryseobacterium sp. SIMBA_028 TaxID=3085771 RepID=UPI003978AA62